MKSSPLQELIKKAINQNITSAIPLQRLKNQYCGKDKLKNITHHELQDTYQNLVEKGIIKADQNFEKLIRIRAIRTLAGVAPIAVLTKSYPCPGKCVYCPTEKNMPKSYLSNEPAVMRAILNNFNPFRQVRARIKGLQRNGHQVSKAELIVMGGTFSYLPKKYQINFIKRCFDALNYPEKSKSLASAQKNNEKTAIRCVGLTLETRPDYIDENELKFFRQLGCTKIEIGLQHIDNKILVLNKRGHTIENAIQSIKLIKDAGFKLCLHMMPNLPGSSVKKDLAMFKKLFTAENYQPDYLKIYPCVVTPYSELSKWWRRGEYKAYSEKQLIDLILNIKKITPPYVRIIRIIRDIPAESILAGNKITNLRQLIQENYKTDCQCIRCREIKGGEINAKDIKLKKISYKSSGGIEFFLSFEDVKHNKLLSLLRLRIPSEFYSKEKHFIPELNNCAIIREVHTYGEQIPVSSKNKKAIQHLGLGKKLIQLAEKIAKNKGLKSIAVISGIGTREYYKRLNYKLKNTYMIKNLST